LFLYCFSLNLLKQIAYAGCSKQQSFQNYKTAGINQEPDFIGGKNEIDVREFLQIILHS